MRQLPGSCRLVVVKHELNFKHSQSVVRVKTFLLFIVNHESQLSV